MHNHGERRLMFDLAAESSANKRTNGLRRTKLQFSRLSTTVQIDCPTSVVLSSLFFIIFLFASMLIASPFIFNPVVFLFKAQKDY